MSSLTLSKHHSSRGENSSRSHKHSSNKDSKHRKHSSSKTHGSTPGNGQGRFLFVVNEVTFNPEVDRPFDVDSWFNQLPPSQAAAYGQEIVSQVFQYDNGQVTSAPNYVWYRPNQGGPGGIVNRATGYPIPMLAYKTGTIFACSPHLPIVVSEGDASCDSISLRRNCACGNGNGNGFFGGGEPSHWNLLSFDRGENGLSLANAQSRDSPYVAGRNPSWIPALVPKVFENDHAPQSQGLGGDLPTIIGLMAFHGGQGRASEVFAAGRWQQNRWNGSTHAPNYPTGGHSPRGFVVHIAMNVASDGLTQDEIDRLAHDFEVFEWTTIFVRG